LKSQVSEDFLDCFARLPESVKALARKSYRLWKENPAHLSLRFKRIHGHESLYSGRIAKDWRAFGYLDDETITWFWIGSHSDYERLIS
jgi:hypothetical protein